MSNHIPFYKDLPSLNVEYDRNPEYIPSPSAPLLPGNYSPPRTQRNYHSNEIPENSKEDLYLFATYLGFDLKKHPEYLNFVSEALKAPLPDGWKEYKDDATDNIYFYNSKLNMATWEHPLDFYYKEIIKREVKKSKSCVVQ